MNVRWPYQFTSRARIWTQSKVTTHKHAQISELIARPFQLQLGEMRARPKTNMLKQERT